MEDKYRKGGRITEFKTTNMSEIYIVKIVPLGWDEFFYTRNIFLCYRKKLKLLCVTAPMFFNLCIFSDWYSVIKYHIS